MRTFLPVFAKDIFHRGLGDLRAVPLALRRSARSSARSPWRRSGNVQNKGRVALTHADLPGRGHVGLRALDLRLTASCVMLFLFGGGHDRRLRDGQSLVQLITTNEMRGRVMSVYNCAFRGGMPMGNLLTGWLVPLFTAPVCSASTDCCWWCWHCISCWSHAAGRRALMVIEERMKLASHSLMAALMAAAAPSPLETARDQQDRAALQKHQREATPPPPPRRPTTPTRNTALALACSYLAEVMIEQHERKPARQIAEQGIKAAEKGRRAEARIRRVLPRARHALRPGDHRHHERPELRPQGQGRASPRRWRSAPKSSTVWVAHGVGNYYLPAQLGGGRQLAIADFRKAIELDPKNAEAYLWLGVSLRKENKDAEARQALTKSLELNPNRVWVKQQLEKTPGQMKRARGRRGRRWRWRC